MNKKEWYQANKHRSKRYYENWKKSSNFKRQQQDPAWQRNYSLLRFYGITSVEWEKLFRKQKRSCAICGKKAVEPMNYKIWHTDHDHKTGLIRGILCTSCNRGLALFDNPVLFTKTINYLGSK